MNDSTVPAPPATAPAVSSPEQVAAFARKVAQAESAEERVALVRAEIAAVEEHASWLRGLRDAIVTGMYQDGETVGRIATAAGVTDSLVSRIARRFGATGRQAQRTPRHDGT